MRKFALIISIVFTVLGSYAQLPLLSPGKMAGQEMTCKAVEGALVLTKSNYRLKDKTDGKFYGRDGNPDFGYGYGVAVKTEDGVIALSTQLMPWNEDNNYQKVSDKYDAVLSSVEICGLDGKEFIPVQKPVSLEGLYQVIDPQTKGGLKIGKGDGEINGWCVWITSKADNRLAIDDLKCQANTRAIEVTDTTKTIDAGNAPQGCRVLGGIYVVPEYLGEGNIRFNILGLLDNTFDKWNVVMPFNGSRISLPKEPVMEEAEEVEIKITPVDDGNVEEQASKDDNGKKNKKNNKNKKSK